MVPPTVFRLQWAHEAKAGFSDLISEAVHHGHPQLVQRRGDHGQAVVASTEDLCRWLAGAFRFSTTVAVSDGEFNARVPELGMSADGATFDEAMAELEDATMAYAQLFFDRIAFYRETDRAAQEPYLALLALTPARQRRQLLLGTPGPTAA